MGSCNNFCSLWDACGYEHKGRCDCVGQRKFRPMIGETPPPDATPSPQATPSEARGPSPELAAAASKFREVLGDRKIVIGPPSPSLDKLREAAQSVVSVLPPRPPNPMIPRTNKDFFQVSYSSLAALDAALADRPHPEEQGEAPDLEALKAAWDDGYETGHHVGKTGTRRECDWFHESRTWARSRTPSQGGAALDVCRSLVAFQREYQANTRDKAPGNDFYAPQLLAIVDAARAALGEPSAPKTELRGPAAQGPAWVLTDKNEAFIHPTKDSAELHRMRMYFPESWVIIPEKGAASVRYVEAGGLEDGKVIWDGVGGSVREIAVQRDRIFGRWDAGVPWALLGILPLEARSAPEPKATGPIPSPVTPEIPIEGDKGPGRECTCVDRCKGAAGLAKGWFCKMAAPGPSPEGQP